MLVTEVELATYLGGIDLTEDQISFIRDVILPGVQQELEIHLNRPVEPTHIRESLMPDENGQVILTVSPVWKILSLDHQGQGTTSPTTYVPPALTFQPVADRVWDSSATGMGGNAYSTPLPNVLTVGPVYGGMLFTASGFSRPYVVVEYIAGYNGYVDSALKLAIMRVAAREVERNFDNTLNIRDGGYVAADASDGRSKGWTDDELAKFDRQRRRVVSA